MSAEMTNKINRLPLQLTNLRARAQTLSRIRAGVETQVCPLLSFYTMSHQENAGNYRKSGTGQVVPWAASNRPARRGSVGAMR